MVIFYLHLRLHCSIIYTQRPPVFREIQCHTGVVFFLFVLLLQLHAMLPFIYFHIKFLIKCEKYLINIVRKWTRRFSCPCRFFIVVVVVVAFSLIFSDLFKQNGSLFEMCGERAPTNGRRNGMWGS